MKPVLLPALTGALLLAGCTMITHVHEYPTKPAVVHDTVYVETGPTPEPGPGPEPEPGSSPGSGSVPESTAPPSGRTVSRVQLNPGTASVETVIDHDLGITTHRMYGNVLSGFGLRFELNAMTVSYDNGADPEYYLLPGFSAMRDWDMETSDPSAGSGVRAAPSSGTSSGSAASSSGELSRSEAAGIAEGEESSSGTSLTLRVGRTTWEFTGSDLDDFDCQGLTIGRYEISLRIPVPAGLLTGLGDAGTAGLNLTDQGEVQEGEIQEENLVNFSTFARDYL